MSLLLRCKTFLGFVEGEKRRKIFCNVSYSRMFQSRDGGKTLKNRYFLSNNYLCLSTWNADVIMIFKIVWIL